jgi:hypothetical protein
METGYYSIRDLKAMIISRNERLFFVDHDAYGNYIEIEFSILEIKKDRMFVDVERFHTSYLNKATVLDEVYTYMIPQADYHKISRKSRYL